MTDLLAGVVGDEADDRCCGHHPHAWGTLAVPGYGFCKACLTRLVDVDEEMEP